MRVEVVEVRLAVDRRCRGGRPCTGADRARERSGRSALRIWRVPSDSSGSAASRPRRGKLRRTMARAPKSSPKRRDAALALHSGGASQCTRRGLCLWWRGRPRQPTVSSRAWAKETRGGRARRLSVDARGQKAARVVQAGIVREGNGDPYGCSSTRRPPALRA